ncbi:aminoglycoside phosphotransferase family protein [Streptomyces gamaensis]|uniref:Aminoglycoside phosphotransferase family protein n=1 Tax=Streptomyces gamaensis TaxID=1763542 RepID=A0ABW0YX52_9ACTN
MSIADHRFEPPERLARSLGAGPADETAHAWLAKLPHTVQEYLERWELTPERVVTPGGRSSMLVLVRQSDGTPAALKLALPDGRAALEHAALTAWHGLGAVRPLRADTEAGVLLLERLSGEVSLRSLTEPKAVLEATATLQRLWVRPPQDHPFPSVADGTARLAGAVREYGAQPWAAEARALAEEALDLREALTAGGQEPDCLLHGAYEQGKVLAGSRAPWLAVGPRPLVGERAYDLAWLVRDRVDTLLASPGSGAGARRRVTRLADALDVDAERLRGWTLFRATHAGLSALAHGSRPAGELLLEFAAML